MRSAATLEPAGPPARDAVRPARPRGGFDPTALWALYLLTLRQHLHGKRWMITAVLFLLPAVLAGCIRATSSGAAPARGLEFLLAFMFIPQGLLPIVALLYGSGLLQDEQEEQTITYLLIRPIPKWALYVVKLLATLTTVTVLTSLFTALTYAAIYAGSPQAAGADVPARCLKAMGVHSLAVVAYCSIFGLISLLTTRTLVVGILYAVIFEGLMANLPFSIRLITVIYYARLIAYRTMGFVIEEPTGQMDIAAEVWGLDTRLDPGLLEHPQVRACLTVLLIGSVVCTALAAFLCSRREFHVKTPEKN